MNQKTTTYVAGAVIAILLIGLILTIGSNARNKKNLASEKLATEKYLTERSAIEKDLAKLKADFSALQQKSDDNARLLSESSLKLEENMKRINTLSGENRSLRTSKNELADLKKTKSELEMEFSRLKSENDRLLAQSSNLQNSLNILEEEKKDLASQFERAQLYNTDNFLATATRGKKNERIVICASRAKKLNMTFEVPQSLTETISFKIITPSGSTINPDDKGISWFFPADSRNLTASLSLVSGEFEQSRQVVLNYSAKEKLIKGEYKIQILSNGNNIGNCRLMLR
jgi:hypothetical protein